MVVDSGGGADGGDGGYRMEIEQQLLASTGPFLSLSVSGRGPDMLRVLICPFLSQEMSIELNIST